MNNVSMESGLDGRNNLFGPYTKNYTAIKVSMESGLDGRNNYAERPLAESIACGLNGVRPRWPEQFELQKV